MPRPKSKVKRECEICGDEYWIIPARLGISRFCSNKCKSVFLSQRRMEKHPGWKGGLENCHGYLYRRIPSHPYSHKRGVVAEHRLVMEKMLGRYLKPIEEVHHLNGIKDDNREENLKLFPNKSAHRKYEEANKKK